MKGARAAFMKNGKLFIQAYSKTTEGLSALDGPVFEVAEKAPQVIGETILKAFNESKIGIYHHIEWRDGKQEEPLLEAAGFKNWNQMMKNSKPVSIWVKGDNLVEFYPTRFKGTTGSDKGYKTLEEKKVISDFKPEHLGRALLEAFSRCEHFLLDK